MLEVPFSRPFFSGKEADALAAVIESRWVTQGPRVVEFEQAFAARAGTAYGVAVTNATSALHLGLLVTGVGPGDEVVVPSLSFIATANAVRHCGAEPVFADVDPLAYNLDPAAAEAAISERTRAIMPVHQIGLAADIDAFTDICERHGVALVEDAAPAIGATYKGRPVGSLGPLACFSLHARKVITTGEGGMITTDDEEVAERLKRLRHHGMSVSDLARHQARDVVFESYLEVGYNYRMTDLQAAVGLCQLDVLDQILADRRRLALRYTSALAELPHVEPPHEPEGRVHSFQSYAVRVSPDAPVARDELMRLLLADGIATRRGVSPAHVEPPYADKGWDLPNTDAAAREALLLPLFPELPESHQDYVIERLATHLGAGA